MFNYQKICQNFIQGLPERTETVVSRRFGLDGGNRQTLQAIGDGFGITRERVRQIERDGILEIKPRTENYPEVFRHFKNEIKNTGELRREAALLETLGGSKFQNHIFFLLTLSDSFDRVSETEEFHSLWTVNLDSLKEAKKAIDFFHGQILEASQPLELKDYNGPVSAKPLPFYIEVSKKVYQGSEGQFGLKEWPEINPKGIKDKVYLVLKKEENPLHFTKAASLIGEDILPQTVHNELIKDERFVLVGRGLYALKEWGYEPGFVKDVILNVLKKAGRPLTKEEIAEKVLKQRFVKESTIVFNVNNPKYFQKTPQGKYIISPVVGS